MTDPALLDAVIDRIIPADADPGALALGTQRYVRAKLAAEAAALAGPVREGLARLAAAGFAGLAPEAKDARLKQVETEDWFVGLVELAYEGFLADPGNGGNDGAGSWKMIGFDERLKR